LYITGKQQVCKSFLQTLLWQGCTGEVPQSFAGKKVCWQGRNSGYCSCYFSSQRTCIINPQTLLARHSEVNGQMPGDMRLPKLL